MTITVNLPKTEVGYTIPIADIKVPVGRNLTLTFNLTKQAELMESDRKLYDKLKIEAVIK